MDDQRCERELRAELAGLLDPVVGSHPRWDASPAAERATSVPTRPWRSSQAGVLWAALVGLLLATLLASALFIGGQSTDIARPSAWTTIEFPEGGAVFDVIDTPTGYLAVGWTEHTASGSDGIVWTSPDCLDWERVPAPEVSRDPGPTMLTYAGGVYLAAGGDDPDGPASLWVSTDGQDWERVASEIISGGRAGGPLATPADISAVRDRFVAVGGSGTTPSFWMSADGREWREVTEVDPRRQGLVGTGWGYVMFEPMSAITTTESAVYAAGTTGRGEAVWRSTDGESWRQVLGGEQATGAVLQGIAASPEGTLVAVGLQWRTETPEEDFGTPVIWHSDDDTTWSTVADMGPFAALQDPPEDGEAMWVDRFARLESVTWAGGRFFILGSEGSAYVPVAWTSTDGRTWSRQPPPGSEESWPIGAFTCEDHVLLYGGTFDRAEGWVRAIDSFTAAEANSG